MMLWWRTHLGVHHEWVSELGDHWERVHESRLPTEMSWYQGDPATSLRLIEAAVSGHSAAVADVGSGSSSLVDHLLARGFTDITLVDVSRRALQRVHDRLGEPSRHVSFVEHDVLTWVPDRQYDLWHDRAVFHFLTERGDRDRYIDLAAQTVCSGGTLLLGTFAPDGPASCSGLPVCRYSATALADVFAGSFFAAGYEREDHVTPSGSRQSFTWAVFERQ